MCVLTQTLLPIISQVHTKSRLSGGVRGDTHDLCVKTSPLRFSITTNKGIQYVHPVMDEVAHTSLSVHFLNKPTVLWVNKNVCHRLLTANTFSFMCDAPRHNQFDVCSLNANSLQSNCQLVHYNGNYPPPYVWDQLSLSLSNISF